jgi:prepilin signal peptidase PulO-like enzyme (type II secretory pathway)
MTAVILFVFGVIIGSFLNVVALRHRSGLTLSGRSHCPHCGKTLHALELVPILSYIFLRGRCRGCRAKISLQYPLVEAWVGLIFLTVFDPALSLLQNIFILFTFCLYVAITIYDFRHKIIPDNLAYLSIFSALLSRFLSMGSFHDWFAGPLLFLFLGGIWLISRGKAMGFGDAKLALSVGLLLGMAEGFSAIVLSFWIGALFGIGVLIYQWINPLLSGAKKITIKSEIPFAPFIILGAWLSIVFHFDILHASLF